ncbi:hypothetical protein PT974_11325 [Cladobotryum mycophilum]|uniref:Nephrocystin 3-like N-terminal domain-containing protein n=1 Tax=Cladobotryum mycophilum TaxID=491253 RepID=A0ABR0S4W1_9HYPO
MEALRRKLTSSPSPSKTVVTTSQIVTEVESSDPESDTTNVGSPTITRKHGRNGSSAFEVNRSLYFTRVKAVERQALETIGQLLTYNESFVSKINITTYLQFISDERISHMPRQGSDWDRVLRSAQFFGLQIWSFGERVDVFIPGKTNPACAALAACQILLEIGHGQAPALLPTFTALYEFSMLLSEIGQIQDLDKLPQEIQEDATHTFCDLVNLVSNIAAYYGQRISDLKDGSTVHISFDACFGAQIDQIWRSKEALYERIWAYKLSGRNLSMSLEELRWKLQATVGQAISNKLYDEVDDHLDRSEETCYWFKDVLSQFLKSYDQVLCVTGAPSSGKTVLAEWVEERLARPFDHKAYAVLRYDFPYDSPEEATQIAFLKSILFQLLERSVGNVQLYEHLARAFGGHTREMSVEQIEASLWNTLRHCLQDIQRGDLSLVIISDGCDGIAGGPQTAANFHKALQECVSRLSQIRVITFCRQVPHLVQGYKYLHITPKEVNEDIQAYFEEVLQKSHFRNMGFDGEKLIEELVAKSKGNWLWAFYAGRLLSREQSKDAVIRASRELKSDISDVLYKVVGSLELKKNHILRNLLSVMLVAERPLAVTELGQFSSVELQKSIVPAFPVNVAQFISQYCGDIAVIRAGHVHFRTEVVRSYMRTQLGKSLLPVQEANRHLTLMMLLYAKLALSTVDEKPTVELLKYEVVGSLFSKHSLLGYVVQNWVGHFRAAGFIGSDDRLNLTKEFSDVFPSSVMFALLERTCWTRLYTNRDLLLRHELALHIREACFGTKHAAVLHNLITLGHIHFKVMNVTNSNIVAARYFYEAVNVGKVVLSETSTIVENCVQLFFDCTRDLVITERTETATYSEEMILFMIRVCTSKYGQSSGEVINWYERLAKLYVAMKEDHQATATYRTLYEMIAIKHGKKSEKAKQIGTYFGTLDIVLKSKSMEKMSELEQVIFETNEELEITDHLSISMWIRLAQSYVACGQLFLAERLYVSLWQRITFTCQKDASVEAHLAKIQVSLEYVRFLHNQNRNEEASNILICLWTEYEHHSFESESIILRIREIGTVCRKFGLLSISANILTKVWGWFKLKGKSNDEEARKTTALITQVVEEITETTVTKKTTITTTTEVTEKAVKEIFEYHLNRCKQSTADVAFFSACKAMIGLYIQQENWRQAEVVIKRTLELTWKAILGVDTRIKLCDDSITDCLFIARRLALSYSRQGFFEMAERVHLQIFYACLATLRLENDLLSEAVIILIGFYEEHHRHKEIIDIYIELLGKYQSGLGRSHRLTIKTLYSLADQCKMIGRESAYNYYFEIFVVLNQGIHHCHPDAVQAALVLCNHYHARGLWTQLQQICSPLWETIILRRGECVITEAEIALVYKTYSQALAFDAKVDFSARYKLAVEYKDVIAAICGVDSSAMIHALIALANICEKNERHYQESVTIYEEVLRKISTTKTTTTTITETTVETVKKRLSRMYMTVIAINGRADSRTTLERAIKIGVETYELYKIEFGCWHEKALFQLKEVVILYQKANTKESRTSIYELLLSSFREIVSVVAVNMALFHSAATLATIFASAGLIAEGQELLYQLRHRIIFQGQWPLNGIILHLDSHLTKVVFIFMAAFEHGLSGQSTSVSHSSIMAEIVLEAFLYEDYSRVADKNNKLEVVLEYGARLRGFWESHKRDQNLAILDDKLFQLFRKEYAQFFDGINDEDVGLLYRCLLVELAKDRPTTKIDLITLACKAANDKIRDLLAEGDFRRASQLGRCIFTFSERQHLYHDRDRIPYGYRLAEYLTGINVPRPTNSKDNEYKVSMLETAKAVMKDVIAAFRTIKIDFASLQFDDIIGLIRLLGELRNFSELDDLLSRLWEVREDVRKTLNCDPAVIIEIGALLVHVQHVRGYAGKAIGNAKLMYYNLRRGRGPLDLQTLNMARLLASIYASAGKPDKAMTTHEEVLREMALPFDKNDNGDGQAKHRFLIEQAKIHLELLKGARNQLGEWTKQSEEFEDLYNRLNNNLKLGTPSFEKWVKSSEDSSYKGKYLYAPPQRWTLDKISNGGLVTQNDSGFRLNVVETARREWYA